MLKWLKEKYTNKKNKHKAKRNFYFLGNFQYRESSRIISERVHKLKKHSQKEEINLVALTLLLSERLRE